MSSYRPRSLGEYAQVIWRRRLLLFFVVAVMLISTFVVINGIPDMYQSSASVVVASNHEEKQVVSARVATLTERINSRAFLEGVMRTHNLYSTDLANGAIDNAAKKMRRNMKLDTTYRNDMPETITITYRNADPAVAKGVAADLVSVFGNMNTAVERGMDDRGKQITAELTDIDNRLRQLGERGAASAASGRVASSSRSAMNEMRAQRVAAESSIETLTDKQYSLEQQIAEQRRQVQEQERIAKLSPSDARSGNSYGVLLVRKAELEAQLKDYGSQYTDKNPKVIQTRTQVAEINNQIAQMSAAAGEDGVPLNSPEARELRSMRRELSRMETELEITKRGIARKQQDIGGAVQPGRKAFYSAPVAAIAAPSTAPITNVAVETDRDRLRDRYNDLLRQQDELTQARSGAAGLDPGLFQMIDQPMEASSPSGPDRWRLRLMALALALAIALLIVAVVEAPRLFAIRDDRDVQYYLEAPIVALIPETLTPHERGRARKMLALRTVGLLVLAFVLVPCLVLVLNEMRLFQLLATRW